MKNEKLYVFRLKHRAAWGDAACGVGQRGVLCEATRRAVLGNAACGEVNQGLYVTQISQITQKFLFEHLKKSGPPDFPQMS